VDPSIATAVLRTNPEGILKGFAFYLKPYVPVILEFKRNPSMEMFSTTGIKVGWEQI
jgi:hypothetical protein